jgi:hypothetical protein
MADLYESRCVSETLMRSDGVVRIACIGDSMIWGQGVPSRQSFPAQLARLLNMALIDDLVWVDNFGESSGNAWHAWTRMRERCAGRAFQAIVFSVCHNDTQIFESNLVEYAHDKRPYWAEDSLHFAHVCRVFKDFDICCRSHGVFPLVIFYSFIDDDRPFIDRLESFLALEHIPFIDMLSYYKQSTNISLETYVASEFDAHPSAFAHELTARRVATELLQGLCGPGTLRGDALGGLTRVVTEFIAQGVPTDAVLDWAKQALLAKEHAARRRRGSNQEGSLGDRGVGSSMSYSDLVERISATDVAWRQSRLVEAALKTSVPTPEFHDLLLPRLAGAIRNLEEAAFLIDHCQTIRELAQIGNAVVKGGYYERTGQLEFFAGDLDAELSQTRATLSSLQIVKLATPELGLALGLDLTLNQCDPLDMTAGSSEIAFAFDAIARLKRQMSALEAAAVRFGRTAMDGESRPIWAMSLQLIRAVTYYLYAIDQICFVHVPTIESTGRPSTSVDVTMEGDPNVHSQERYCRLIAEIDYVVPKRLRIREVLWAGVAKARAIYHFELPIMILGNLRIGVLENEPTRQRFLDGTTRLTSVIVSNYPGAQPVDDQSRCRFPRAVAWSDPDNRQPLLTFPGLLLR